MPVSSAYSEKKGGAMPAIVAHDTFGKQAYELIREEVGSSKDRVEAFLLGNQGPDPLFYVVADPTLSDWHRLGNRLHREKTDEVLAAMKRSLAVLSDSDAEIGRAYMLGFLCHYLLDSTVHPLVYAQEYALCDAGIAGLSRANGDAVHATIECEFDEVMMSRHLNVTMAEWSPAKNILRASRHVLKVVSTMYLYVSLEAFNDVPPAQLFLRSVKLFRAAETIFVSPTGIKRRLAVKTEEALKKVSSFGSLSMHPIPMEESAFENNAHDTWIDPATGEERTECFENLYERALGRVRECADVMLAKGFDVDAAAHITLGLNFNGVPISGALILDAS